MPATLTARTRPLCVDLDGTLLATDILWESVVLLARTRPAKLFLLPFWLLGGKARLKRRLAQEVAPDPRTLPYRPEVLALLDAEHRCGRPLILATASDIGIARSIAEHLRIFTTVIGSDGTTNAAGVHKLRALQEHCAGTGFDYIGDSRADLPLWRAADGAIVVDPPRRLLARVTREARVRQVLRPARPGVRTFLRALRVHQWTKNGLLLVPVLLGHQLTDPGVLLRAAIAFIAFSLCASAVYITNDLLDLEADRAHPRKKNRPFAAGLLAIPTGLALVPALLALAFGLSVALLPPLFTAVLGGYLVVSTAYSLYIKRLLLLDVFLLAGLYTLRVLAGGVATAIVISPWLAAFSMFFFTSLAFLKRYSELRLLHERQMTATRGRDYAVADMDMLRSIGSASGYVSVLVLALYTNSVEVLELYPRPTALWLVLPVLLYWITRIWFLAHRGQVADDPILFTVRDRTSLVAGLVVAAVMIGASL